MKTTDSIHEIRHLLRDDRKGTIALVPTMGYLHSGHMKLVEAARKNADIVVVSIFVNPLQFGPDEDLDSYPRDLKHDLEMCESQGVDYVFNPSETEMYPKEPEMNLSINNMASILDGRRRPGHFEGVVTVCNKLFNIVEPDYVTFGEKDRQQLMIVERLIQDFNHDTEILPVPTEREADGLAKSSRNVNLSEAERREAPEIFKSLQYGKELIEEGERSTHAVRAGMIEYINAHISGDVDDLQIYSHPDLDEVQDITDDVIIFIAVKYDKARLIDNMLVTLNV